MRLEFEERPGVGHVYEVRKTVKGSFCDPACAVGVASVSPVLAVSLVILVLSRHHVS